MKSTKSWLILLALLALLALAALFWIQQSRSVGTQVEIYQNNIHIKTLPLDLDTELALHASTAADAGTNTVEIRDGAVRVSQASCPDQICVRRGATRHTADPIVCLPHRLELRVVGAASGTLDGVTG